MSDGPDKHTTDPCDSITACFSNTITTTFDGPVKFDSATGRPISGIIDVKRDFKSSAEVRMACCVSFCVGARRRWGGRTKRASQKNKFFRAHDLTRWWLCVPSLFYTPQVFEELTGGDDFFELPPGFYPEAEGGMQLLAPADYRGFVHSDTHMTARSGGLVRRDVSWSVSL